MSEGRKALIKAKVHFLKFKNNVTILGEKPYCVCRVIPACSVWLCRYLKNVLFWAESHDFISHCWWWKNKGEHIASPKIIVESPWGKNSKTVRRLYCSSIYHTWKGCCSSHSFPEKRDNVAWNWYNQELRKRVVDYLEITNIRTGRRTKLPLKSSTIIWWTTTPPFLLDLIEGWFFEGSIILA